MVDHDDDDDDDEDSGLHIIQTYPSSFYSTLVYFIAVTDQLQQC
jgi:hypothetical protein